MPARPAPPPVRIKICGIGNLADGLAACRLGIEYIGLIFYPPSPRYIEAPRAAKLVADLRDAMGRENRPMPAVIGVFVDETPDYMQSVREEVGLDGVQLSGDEPPETLAALAPVRFRGMSLATLERLGRHPCEAYLCDAHDPERKGGTGKAYDYRALAGCVSRFPIIVAGGLTPDTVGAVVRDLAPWGVDVSSAVETSPGVKDHDRMRAFVEAVRQAYAAEKT